MKRDTFSPYLTAAGFEPAKRDAQDLKSRPVDQTRERCLNAFLSERLFALFSRRIMSFTTTSVLNFFTPSGLSQLLVFK